MARDVTLRIVGDVNRAESEIRRLQATGQQVASVLEQSFDRLGVQSTVSVEAQKAAYVQAYEQIRNSGVATWQEVQTAHAAMVAKVTALDASLKPQGLKSVGQSLDDMGSAVDRLTPRFIGLVGTIAAFYIGSKLWEGFKYGIEAVDTFQQSVTKTAAIITSLQGGQDLAGNYQKAKEYAAGLNDVLMQVDSRTNLNLESLQSITEEMIKQGVVLDYTNKDQVEGFTRLANAVAVYSRNGADERQLRQEVSALLRGQVDQNSQLASMLQRTVDGPLKQQVEQWKASGTLVAELGSRLGGFGPAAEDLASSWSAVKSSLETSISLVARAGFTEIVKDVAGWLGKINEYLKTHREEIGGKIKGAWEELKSIMSGAASVAKFLYDNFEPFAVLFIGGTLLSGMVKVREVFKDMRDLAIATRGAMIGLGLVSAGAGAAGAATGAATAAGGAAAGAGAAAAGGGLLASILGGGAAVLGGLGLGYALQPVVRWTDKALYNAFGINLTGEEMYNQNEARNVQATQNLNAAMARRPSSAATVIPQLNLGDSPEVVAEKIKLQERDLAAFKAGEEAKTAAAKDQAAIRLSILKSSYDQGLISTQTYYKMEIQASLDAAQQRFQNAAEYLKREEELLAYIASKKGASSPEYSEELAKNKKATQEMQDAQLNYAKTYLDGEEKMRLALQQREAEYAKMRVEALQDAGDFEGAERARQDGYRKTAEYLRLEADALDGNASAWQAMMDLEQKESLASFAAQQRKRNELAQYTQEIAKLKDQVDALNGKDQDLIKSESNLRDGLEKERQLRERLATAASTQNSAAVIALNTQIALQDLLNQRMQAAIDLKNREDELTGKIVGWNGNTPIYANQGGAFSNGQQVPTYVTNSQLLTRAQQDAATAGRNYWGEPVDKYGNVINRFGLPGAVSLNDPFGSGWSSWSFDVGTPYVPHDMIAKIHKGERIITAADNASGNYGSTSFDFSGMTVVVQGGGAVDTDAIVDAFTRKLAPKLDDLNRRRRTA